MGKLDTITNLPESEASAMFGQFCSELKIQLKEQGKLITDNMRASSDLIALSDAIDLFGIPPHYIYSPSKGIGFETPTATDLKGRRVRAISIRNIIFAVYLLAKSRQSDTKVLTNHLVAHFKRVKSTGILKTDELKLVKDFLYRPSDLEIRMRGVIAPESQDRDDEPTQETKTYSDKDLEG